MRQILHISDVHFGPYHAPEVAAGVAALVAEQRPDLVVISGDLTQRAKPRQFREARAWVDDLGAPVLAVPGNHDVPLYRVWERFGSPYGAYKHHFSSDLEPTFEDDELFVLGINSAFGWTFKDGRIRSRRLREVGERLAEAPAGKARFVVVHHELVPAPRFDTRRVLRGTRKAVEVFSRHGVEVVLSGHLHQTHVTPSDAYHPKVQPSFLVVQSGTTTSRRGRGCERQRYTCNWLTIDDSEVRVDCLRWDPDDSLSRETGGGRWLRTSRHGYPRRPAPFCPTPGATPDAERG